MDGTEPARLGLFEAYGIEIEYMIVDRETLDVRPFSDRILAAVAGSVVSEVECGALAWSNELSMHVIELKTNGPSPHLFGLAESFQSDVRRINGLLAPHGACLMPTSMHPWMDPLRESRLWTHEYSPVYARYDAIFDCRGHGWSNLQAIHVNLPFADDAEFERLHAAVRLALPILPALAASSPVFDARPQDLDDSRMGFYREHTRRVPSLVGAVVPERVWSRAAYESQVLGRIYADLAPFDPEGVLRHEFANARGAIARFDRHAIEIRVLDTQECAAMDLAVAAAVVALVQALVDERWSTLERQKIWEEGRLARILWRTVESSSQAQISDRDYLRVLGMEGVPSATAGELWRHLCDELLPGSESAALLSVILEQGSLARRIRERLGADPAREDLSAVYAELCDCLHQGRPFLLGA